MAFDVFKYVEKIEKEMGKVKEIKGKVEKTISGLKEWIERLNERLNECNAFQELSQAMYQIGLSTYTNPIEAHKALKEVTPRVAELKEKAQEKTIRRVLSDYLKAAPKLVKEMKKVANYMIKQLTAQLELLKLNYEREKGELDKKYGEQIERINKQLGSLKAYSFN